MNLTRGHHAKFFLHLNTQTITKLTSTIFCSKVNRKKSSTLFTCQIQENIMLVLKKGYKLCSMYPRHYTFACRWKGQLRFNRRDVATLFKASDAFSRSEAEWPAETNNRMPADRLHLSRVDLLDVTRRTESSFNTCRWGGAEGVELSGKYHFERMKSQYLHK